MGAMLVKFYSAGVWFWVHGMGAMLVKVYSVGVGVFECVVQVLSTVQVCVVLGAWLVRSLLGRCAWFWVSSVGAALVKVYSAGVCGFG